LGEDDYEVPRILVEYTVVGGKYTNVVNNVESLKDKLEGKEEEKKFQKKKPKQQ